MIEDMICLKPFQTCICKEISIIFLRWMQNYTKQYAAAFRLESKETLFQRFPHALLELQEEIINLV